MSISNKIERRHIIEAIQQIDREGVPPKFKSTSHFLIYGGKRYPPKYIICLANSLVSLNQGNIVQVEDFEPFHTHEAKKFLKNLDFDVETLKLDNYDEEELPNRIIFPKNEDLSIEKLAQIYRDIEENKDVISNIEIPSDCNVIPASRKGECREKLVGMIIDRKDFGKRMPEILASLIRCKHRQVLICTCYWDGKEWEKTWKKPFKAAGGRIYRQLYDGYPERIL